jgi:hypothetical protein
MPNNYRIFHHVPNFISITKMKSAELEFDSLRNTQTKLNSGSIPEFNIKCGFDSRLYDMKNFRNT